MANRTNEEAPPPSRYDPRIRRPWLLFMGILLVCLLRLDAWHLLWSSRLASTSVRGWLLVVVLCIAVLLTAAVGSRSRVLLVRVSDGLEVGTFLAASAVIGSSDSLGIGIRPRHLHSATGWRESLLFTALTVDYFTGAKSDRFVWVPIAALYLVLSPWWDETALPQATRALLAVAAAIAIGYLLLMVRGRQTRSAGN